MKLSIEPGKYVVAVSGGVDSVCLLNMLSNMPGLELVVAHFDHGIREDSAADREFVKGLAEKYGPPFIAAEGRLGPLASEAVAREARYKFLHRVVEEHGARAIITAHHEDDALETAIINLLRGTGRKGLTALESRPDIVRPLLHVPKAELLTYAKKHDLAWREDSTNDDTKYLRNYVRRQIMPRLGADGREKLNKLLHDQRTVNAQLDALLSAQLAGQVETIQRRWFVSLAHRTALEVMAAWLRANGLSSFDRPTLERAVVGAKTARLGQKIALKSDIFLEVTATELALRYPER